MSIPDGVEYWWVVRLDIKVTHSARQLSDEHFNLHL